MQSLPNRSSISSSSTHLNCQDSHVSFHLRCFSSSRAKCRLLNTKLRVSIADLITLSFHCQSNHRWLTFFLIIMVWVQESFLKHLTKLCDLFSLLVLLPLHKSLFRPLSSCSLSLYSIFKCYCFCEDWIPKLRVRPLCTNISFMFLLTMFY